MREREWVGTLCKALAFFGALIVLMAGIIMVQKRMDPPGDPALAANASANVLPASPTPSIAPAQSRPPEISLAAASPTPAQTTPMPTPTTSADADAGLWTYTDKDMQVRIERVHGEASGRVYTAYVADIILTDMRAMRSLLANDKLGSSERVESMAERADAIVSINGDFYSYRSDGIIVRNGEVIRENPAREMAVIYMDGNMDVVSEYAFDLASAMESGLLHTYSFGPGLVSGGVMPEKYVSSVSKANPRTAIGMIEPGHFIFMVVDGRSSEYSNGMSMQDLGQFMLDLGCTEAYNLDGGASSEMCFMGETINRPSNGGRRTSDILYITPP